MFQKGQNKMTTKKAREFWIKDFNQLFSDQRVYNKNLLPHDFPEVEYLRVREVLPVDEITEDEINEAANDYDNDIQICSPERGFKAGAKWAISEMKKRGRM